MIDTSFDRQQLTLPTGIAFQVFVQRGTLQFRSPVNQNCSDITILSPERPRKCSMAIIRHGINDTSAIQQHSCNICLSSVANIVKGSVSSFVNSTHNRDEQPCQVQRIGLKCLPHATQSSHDCRQWWHPHWPQGEVVYTEQRATGRKPWSVEGKPCPLNRTVKRRGSTRAACVHIHSSVHTHTMQHQQKCDPYFASISIINYYLRDKKNVLKFL